MIKPLAGIRVVEFASIGPGPFAAMMLADHGADIVRVDKPGGRDVGTSRSAHDPMLRGRRTVELDLKNSDDVERALALTARCDVLIEGLRPGVMERLGLGPETAMARNPALIYARMTGWGQDGPLAARAGHDINYIALTGALDGVGTKNSGPVPAMNLIGDFGGGGMLMAFGITTALLQAKTNGKGRVIDAAMVEGAALLMMMPYALKHQGLWPGGRGENLLDGGAPFYGTYQTKDGKWIALGAIEEPFWQELTVKLALSEPAIAQRHDRRKWPDIHRIIAGKIASENRDHWDAVFDGSDACYAPVLTMEEAPDHPHNRARGVFRRVDGVMQPSPAPRFDGAAAETPRTDPTIHDYDEVMESWN